LKKLKKMTMAGVMHVA